MSDKKLVFSKEKWEECIIREGNDPSDYTWPDRCEGLTENEMLKREYCLTKEEWMVEV